MVHKRWQCGLCCSLVSTAIAFITTTFSSIVCLFLHEDVELLLELSH